MLDDKDLRPCPGDVVICADDYGISDGTNAVILDLLANGTINATTCLVDTASWETSGALLRDLADQRPGIAVGLHMNLTERFAKCAAPEAIRPAASWITRSALPVSKRETVRILSSFSTQWSRFIEYFGRAPDFIDGHHHIHLLQAPRRALFRLVREKGFKGWLRQCRASSRRAWVQQLILDGPSARFAQCAIATGFCINPGFGGLRVFLRSEDLAKLWQSDLLAMPSGGLLIVHPGTTGSPPGTDVIDLCRVDEAAMLSTGRMRDILQSAHLKLAADARAPGWG